MRAVVCETFDGLQSLTVREVDKPAFGPPGVPGAAARDVRIRVHAAGINFADTLIVQGKYQLKPALPFSPGMEVAGEVTEVADGVTSVQVGQRVMANVLFGGYAEEVVAPANCVYAIPDSMDWASAAAFPIAYGTSHVGLVERANLQAGEFLVVHGAAGGVGLTAVEIGKYLGATVIASAGGPEKLEIARQHGADHLIDYTKENVRDRVKELTGGLGAHVIYDPVGGDVGPNASKVLAAAMGNCLTASLLFCLNKARAEVGGIETNVEGRMRRNEKGRWRIAEINVDISPEMDMEYFGSQYERCSKLFEDFCIVSKSIEEGIPVNVQVKPR